MIDNFLCARVWGRFFQVQLAEQLHQVAREREGDNKDREDHCLLGYAGGYLRDISRSAVCFLQRMSGFLPRFLRNIEKLKVWIFLVTP